MERSSRLLDDERTREITAGLRREPARVGADEAKPDAPPRRPVYLEPAPAAAINALAGFGFYDRSGIIEETLPEGVSSMDEERPLADLERVEGYFLNWQRLTVLPLPPTAKIAGTSCAPMVRALTFGCVFDAAPGLPPLFRESVEHWSGPAEPPEDEGAVYYQPEAHAYPILREYMPEAVAALLPPPEVDEDGNEVIKDKLVSRGVVVEILSAGRIAREAGPDGFVEVLVPVDSQLATRPGGFFNAQEASGAAGLPDPSAEGAVFYRVYLAAKDVLGAPDPDRLMIDLIRDEYLDYGYFY